MSTQPDKEKGFLGEFAALVKKHFGSAPPPKEFKFGESKLKDGTPIAWASEGPVPMENEQVVVMGPDGTAIPAPDGTHALADGTVIVVAGGVAKTVTPAGGGSGNPGGGAPPAGAMGEQQVKSLITSIVEEKRFASEDAIAQIKTDFEAYKTATDAALAAANKRAEDAEKKYDAEKGKFEAFSGEMIKMIGEFTAKPDGGKDGADDQPGEETYEQKFEKFKKAAFPKHN